MHWPPHNEGAEEIEEDQIAGSVLRYVGDLMALCHASGQRENIVAGTLDRTQRYLLHIVVFRVVDVTIRRPRKIQT